MACHHPNLEEAVQAFRQYLPADHRILYQPKTAGDQEPEPEPLAC